MNCNKTAQGKIDNIFTLLWLTEVGAASHHCLCTELGICIAWTKLSSLAIKGSFPGW